MNALQSGLLVVMAAGVAVLILNARIARVELRASVTRARMQYAVSLIVLGAALYIILSGTYPDSYAKWAFGAVGTILGFWLRPQ